MSEHEERMTSFAEQFPGPRGRAGEQGKQGEKGKTGEPGRAKLPPGVFRALLFFVGLFSVLFIVGFGVVYHFIQANNQTRCSTISAVAAIPIPKQLAGHDARLWEAQFEGIYRARARQLGCPFTHPKGK